MCLWIPCIIDLCIIDSRGHLLKPRLQHLSLLGETLICSSIPYQTLCLGSRYIHRVRIVLGWLMLLASTVILIETLVQVLNLWRSLVGYTIAHLNWWQLWSGALARVWLHLLLVFRCCTTIKQMGYKEDNILTWSFWGYGPFWLLENQRRPPHHRSLCHPSFASFAMATVNCGVGPFDLHCPATHSRMKCATVQCHPPCWVSSICPLKEVFDIIEK